MTDDASQTTMSDMPCASLMIGDLEFLSQSDGSVLIMRGPEHGPLGQIPPVLVSVEKHQIVQLHVWLSNHLRMGL